MKAQRACAVGVYMEASNFIGLRACLLRVDPPASAEHALTTSWPGCGVSFWRGPRQTRRRFSVGCSAAGKRVEKHVSKFVGEC